ncbi:MAG: insulinase family protein [Candidatus Aegiribacteria sp.]|nr:insulinase family protein [Candidatus Aegiribacteria sp.]
MKNTLCLLLLVSVIQVLSADPVVYTLDNGLTVVLEEMHYSPTVAVVTRYNVGSRNETDEISGISHFVEHMLFNGTQDIPGIRFWQITKKNGGQANGYTGNDFTTYYLYFPVAALEEALLIESDRMQNCLMDSAGIAQEIGVVMDEWRLSEDSPDRALYYEANSVFYGEHPYRRTVLGTSEAIAAFDRQKVTDYYNTWYQPSNATLTIVGDFNSEDVLALVEEYFGGIPFADIPSLGIDDRESFAGPFRLEVDFPAETDRVSFYFDGCSIDDPDMPALSLIAYYLGRGRISWMERNLVTPGIATMAWASAPGMIDISPFAVSVFPAEGVSPDSVIAIIEAEMYSLTETLIDSAELDIVKNYIQGREVMSENTPLDRALAMTNNQSTLGDPLASQKLRDEIMVLTPEEVRAVAAKYFTPDRLMVTVLNAQEGSTTARHAPTDGISDIEVPEIIDWEGLNLSSEALIVPEYSVSHGTQRFELDNGLVLLVKEDSSFPVIEMMITFPMGDRRAEQNLSGISSLTTEVMLHGTEELDQTEFHARLAEKGSTTWLMPNNSFTIGNVYGHSDYTDLYFTSLSDLLMRPAMRNDDFLKVRDRMIAMAILQNENVFNRAFSNIDEILLEEGGSRTADSATLASIDLADVESWLETCVRPDGTVLAVVGDISPERALELTEQYFGDWDNPSMALPAAEEYIFNSCPGDTVIETIEGRIQVAAMLACPAPEVLSPNYIPFNIMCQILGGGISSRMGLNIRETQGLAYAVGCWVDGPAGGTPTGTRFQAYFSTGAPMLERAIEAVIYECDRIAVNGVEESELLLQQSRSFGRNAFAFDEYDSVARFLVTQETLGLPLDQDITDLETILALRPGMIREMAAEYFKGIWFISVAGGIDEQMQPLE